MLNKINQDGVLIIKLPARLDTAYSQESEAELNETDVDCDSMVFDFSDVNFISSYFIRICLNKYKTFGNDKFKIVNVKSEIKKVFMIAGLDKIISVH